MRSKIVLLPALALLCAVSAGRAAPPGLQARRVDLDFKDASPASVYRFLSYIGGRPVFVSSCVTARGQRITLKLANVPPALVFDALAAKLGVAYRSQPDGIHVECVEGAPPPPESLPGPKTEQEERDARRTSIDVREAPASRVLAMIARAGGWPKSEWRAQRDPPVTMTLENVSVGALIYVFVDTVGLGVLQTPGALVVCDNGAVCPIVPHE